MMSQMLLQHSVHWQPRQTIHRRLHGCTKALCCPALHESTNIHDHVNEAHKHLFTLNGRSIDAPPPTREALIQHIKRAAYQAGFIWGQTMVCTPELPSPSEWGWVHTNNGWGIHWTTLPEATEACRQLLKCGCKKVAEDKCGNVCKCVKAALQCTALCHCGGECTRA